MNKITFILIAFVLWSCGSSDSDTPSDVSDSSDIQDVQPTVQVDNSTWEGFWSEFQAAVKSGDSTQIKSLAIWNDTFDENHFDEMQNMYFSPEMIKLILETKADAVENTDAVSMYAKDGRQVSLQESGYDEEENIEYESALFLYFGKVGEKYALVNWMAAG